MRILILALLLWASSAFAQFTEFYCDTAVGASNIYSGSTSSTTPTYITLSGDWNGTAVFTPNDGSTPASSVTAGTNVWAAVSFTAQPTNAVYLAVVDTVAAGANGAITLSTHSFAGTAPASSASAHTMTLVVGGVWRGPITNRNPSVIFPFKFAAATMTNESSGTAPIVWFRTGRYDTTNAIVNNIAGPVTFSGYSSVPGDSGRATLNGHFAGDPYVLLSNPSGNWAFLNFIFAENGTGGGANLVTATGFSDYFYNCTFHDSMNVGLSASSDAIVEACEAYNCNLNGNLASAFNLNNSVAFRCIAYSNTTVNSCGFQCAGSGGMQDCVSAYNAVDGFQLKPSGGAEVYIVNCCAYSNSLHGADIKSADLGSSVLIENCNFIRNGGAGITNSSGPMIGRIVNCGFGSGVSTNVGGNYWISAGMANVNPLIYASGAVPWNSPTTGDFSIVLTAAKSVGAGDFQESSGWTGTVGHFDIGAAQSSSTNSSGGTSGGSWSFAQ